MALSDSALGGEINLTMDHFVTNLKSFSDFENETELATYINSNLYIKWFAHVFALKCLTKLFQHFTVGDETLIFICTAWKEPSLMFLLLLLLFCF